MRRGLVLVAGAILVGIIAAAAVAVHPFSSPGSDTAPDIGGPFALTAPDGHTVTDADFRGRWMLVYFGYTHCPDVCPMTLNSIATALDRLGRDRARIAPVFITVDPDRDTPAVIGRYVALFDKQIEGLTGTGPQIARVEREYHVYAARHATRDGGYSMDHSSIIYVMDPHGRWRTFIDAGASPGDMAAKLARLDS